MQKIIHKSESRGKVAIGWLKSWHSFSFGQWYNPKKINFGALRVINDDIIAGGMGFGKHPHDNMEIVTIPLSGALHHQDTTGRDEVIRTGDVQIMSAGSGIAHSEHNHSKQEDVTLLQIWVFPKLRNILPRYEQKTFHESERRNQWQIVVSPNEADGGLNINQDAYFSLANIEIGKTLAYKTRSQENGVYFFLIDGELNLAGEFISKRDAIGIWDFEKLEIAATQNSKLLAIEVPMKF